MSNVGPEGDVEQASASSQVGEKDVVVSPEAVGSQDDPAAPSTKVSGSRQRISDIFTIIAAGAGLASDGYVSHQLEHVGYRAEMLTRASDTRTT